MINTIRVRIVTKSSLLPTMTCDDFFHSADFFAMIEKTPRMSPYMAVAEDGNGKVVAHMLASISYHGAAIPPIVYSIGRVYGEGEYCEGTDQEAVFSKMLKAITKEFRQKLCLYAEFSHVSTKMFGYKHFRRNGYFPIQWQEIHNSLHSQPPANRLSEKTKNKIDAALKRGASSQLLSGEAELESFYKLLKNYFRFKSRRSIPSIEMFRMVGKSGNGKIFVTKYKDKIIGGCVCLFSQENAYLWFLAAKRKSFITLHPDTLTVWEAINYAYRNSIKHFYFLDAGLPFSKSPIREFILRFGGKPVATYRWFKLPIPLMNKLLSWLYND